MSASTTLLRFQPSTMSTAQLAAVSFLARYAGRTHALYAFQLREWLSWCERNGLDPLVGVQRAHLELYIRGLGERGLMDSSVVTMMHEVRGDFRFAHRRADLGRSGDLRTPAPKVHRDESRTHGLDRLIHHLQAVAEGASNPPRSVRSGAAPLRHLRGLAVLHQ